MRNKYHIDAASWVLYKGLMAVFVYSSHPHLVATPFCLLKVTLAAALTGKLW